MLNLNIQNWILYPLLRERGQMEFAVEIGSHLPHTLLVWQRFEDVGTAGDSKQQLVLKAVLDSAVQSSSVLMEKPSLQPFVFKNHSDLSKFQYSFPLFEESITRSSV